MRPRSSESGSVAVIVAICMTVFLGFAALGLDLAIGRYARMQLENATDAAAHAALVRLRATRQPRGGDRAWRSPWLPLTRCGART